MSNVFELYAEVQLTFAVYAKVATFYYVCMICLRKKYSIFRFLIYLMVYIERRITFSNVGEVGYVLTFWGESLLSVDTKKAHNQNTPSSIS